MDCRRAGTTGRLFGQAVAKVTAYSVNTNIPKSELHFEFPVGTYVSDLRMEDIYSRSYIVRQGGKKRIITKEELRRGAGADYKELLSTESGMARGNSADQSGKTSAAKPAGELSPALVESLWLVGKDSKPPFPLGTRIHIEDGKAVVRLRDVTDTIPTAGPEAVRLQQNWDGESLAWGGEAQIFFYIWRGPVGRPTAEKRCFFAGGRPQRPPRDSCSQTMLETGTSGQSCPSILICPMIAVPRKKKRCGVMFEWPTFVNGNCGWMFSQADLFEREW